MQPQELVAEVWDIKKIIFGLLGVVVIVGGGVLGFEYIKNNGLLSKNQIEVTPKKNVMGISNSEENRPNPKNNQNTFSLPSSKEQLKDQLENIKKQVGFLSVSEIASSSPQVQKVLQDLKALEEYPHNQAKDMCQKICSSF